MMLNDKSMIKEMIFIIIVYGFVSAFFEIIFAKQTAFSLLGLMIGCLLAVYMIIYMNIVLERCMDPNNGYDSKTIEKYITKHSIIRYLSIVIVFGAVCITGIADPIACFIGILGLKAAAYLQPIVRKLRIKKTAD